MGARLALLLLPVSSVLPLFLITEPRPLSHVCTMIAEVQVTPTSLFFFIVEILEISCGFLTGLLLFSFLASTSQLRLILSRCSTDGRYLRTRRAVGW